LPSFKTILFPIDFSDRCRSAARHVRTMASRFGARLILLNVVELPRTYPGDLDFGALVDPALVGEPGPGAKELLDRFLEADFVGLHVERRVERGDPARTIVRIAHEEHVDLIMMPTHGYGGFRRFILGSVTAKVLHDAECAVWTAVHLEDAPAADGAIHNVVCAIDLTESGSSPLAAAVAIAKPYDAQLTVTHAVPGGEGFPDKQMDMEFRQHLISEAKASISAMLASAGIQADMCVEAGDAHKVVNACARAHKAELVVIGRPRHEGFGRLRTHSYAIIRESPCPVISL
jgi:nucleotide-binding universal stress UspA family protein